MFGMFTEECMRPKGSDKAFVGKLVAMHGEHPHLEQTYVYLSYLPTPYPLPYPSNIPSYLPPYRSKLKVLHAFIIKHDAGGVVYTTAGEMEDGGGGGGEMVTSFLEKNRDTLQVKLPTYVPIYIPYVLTYLLPG